MALFGTALKKALPFGVLGNLVPKGTGAAIGNSISSFKNGLLPQTYSAQSPVISSLFGSSKAYAAEPPANNSQGEVNGVTTDNRLPTYNDTTNKPTTSFGTVKPTTGGQGTGNGGGGGGINLAPPIPDTAGLGDDSGRLREAFGIARSGIEAQGRGLDESYALSRGDIENSIADSERAAATQKEGLGNQYGSLLRNQLQTYKDTNSQRNNIFSSLGTLESSAYGDAQQRADSSYSTDRATTEGEQVRAFKSVDDELGSFKKQATSELARFALQYQQGKSAIAQALAQNNLEEAGAIQNSIDNIRSRANEIQNTLVNFSNQVALMKSQGQQVNSKIGGVNADEYTGVVNQNLNNQVKQLSSLAPQQNQFSFSGFIGPDGKRYNSKEEYLRTQNVA